MSKEKQIEEMAKDVTYSIVWDSDGYATVDCLATAQKLHLKGYRKQSEVIDEFAKRLKENLDISVCGFSSEEVTYDVELTIDELVEEMKGGE